jgi:hypothetical protein
METIETKDPAFSPITWLYFSGAHATDATAAFGDKVADIEVHCMDSAMDVVAKLGN